MSISELYRAVSTANSPATPEKKPAADAKAKPSLAASGGGKNEFHELLQKNVETTPPTPEKKLHFSQHADTRIRSRAIAWDEALEKRVIAGLDAAEAKGSRETLILADNVALIANVRSRTVVTAMDRTQLKEQIFTNIDSTVLV